MSFQNMVDSEFRQSLMDAGIKQSEVTEVEEELFEINLDDYPEEIQMAIPLDVVLEEKHTTDHTIYCVVFIEMIVYYFGCLGYGMI